MSTSLSNRFFNPLMLWLDVALKTQEMWLSSGSVIQQRTQRMARAGLAPGPDDLAEMQLMAHEKLAAVGESGVAIVNQLHSTQFGLSNRMIRHWNDGTTAWVGLSISTTPAQIAGHVDALATASSRAAAAWSQFSSAGARIVQRGLKPIHSKAVSNARRLALPPG